jgi:hypothetical protein
MRRALLLLGPVALALCGLSAAGADGPKDRPVAVGGGEVGDLLRRWWRDEAAAGNVGDWYDNRDGGHSDLDLAPYPQVQRFVYSAEDVRLRRHWALQVQTRPEVTFGNSSTSAPVEQGGSNPRTVYTARGGLALLYRQYLHNNVYVYPEHRDHDPGHNGDGFGDLYPTNTPYLIISQGSSGSDQPFMRAIPSTLAAFQPEVKRRLVQTGLLMPTLQMILRRTSKRLRDRGEYLTGKAHPSVFEGEWVDPLAMVRLAHAINLEEIPPLVQLKVVREDQPVPGRDFFEPGGSERLADTPAVAARVFRGKERTRRVVVSAEGSYDLNGRELTFEWVLLRGDPERVQIRPLNAERSAAEIVVAYHERRPVAPGSALESNRVDVGVIVHNQVHFAAPAFITFFSLDSESRTYDDRGRALEIGYGVGEVKLTVPDWSALLTAALSDAPAGRLLALAKEDREALGAAAPECKELYAALGKAKQARQEAEAARQKAGEGEKKKAEEAVQAAGKSLEAAEKALKDFLERPLAAGRPSLKSALEKALDDLVRNPTLYADHADTFSRLYRSADGPARAAVAAARKRLVGMGVAKDGPGDTLRPQPIRPGAGPVAERLTPYEKAMLQRFHLEALTRLVYPGLLGGSYRVNYVDPRLSAPKAWRDVYRYDAQGHPLGWTRYDGERATAFNPDGLLVLKTDDRGRCVRARTVRYTQALPGRGTPAWGALQYVPADQIVTYEYAGDQDWKGRIKSMGPVQN